MNYNYIAPYYDFLSRLCFLNRQQMAHKIILNYVKPNDKILWLGGGSGWFLPKMDELGFPLTIDYVEVSTIMINKAKQHKLKHLSVNFITQDILHFYPDKIYDVVITAFIFDHFTTTDCQEMFYRFTLNLNHKAKWIYIDFNEDQNQMQRLLTKTMVVFFNLVAGFRTNDFPKVDILFNSYQLIDKQSYFLDYIQSKIYQK